MESFVANIVTDISSTSVAFVQDVITGYWGTILSILFVGTIIGLFWRMGRRATGR